MPDKKLNTIGTRIFIQSLLIAIVLTVFLTSIQVWMDYRNLVGSLEITFDQVSATQADGISTALWNFSKPELNALMAGLVNYPFIVYAEIRDGDEVILSMGKPIQEGVLEKTIPLIYNDSATRVKVGDLRLQASQAKLFATINDSILNVVLFRAVTILLVTLIMLVMVDRQVFRYLRNASQVLNTYEIDSLDKPLQVNKPNQNDEIDWLVVSFNDLRQRLSQSIISNMETERKHSTLLTNLPGMAYRCRNDHDWTMEVVSAGCLDLTGYSSDELIGNQNISYNDLILPEDREDIWNSIQTQVKDRAPFELNYRIERKDGQIRWVWERGAGVFSEDHKLIALEGFITDITERKQQERDLEAIARVSFALRSVETREKILPVILEQTTQLLDADGCLLELIDPETGDSVVKVANGVFEGFVGNRIPPDLGLNSYIRETGKPYHSNNAPEDPRIIDDLSDKSCRASSGVPLTAQGELLGFLWIARRKLISEKAVQTLSSIADIAANAIHRVDLFQQTKRRLDQLTGLRKIDSAINSNVELKDTLEVFMDQTINLLHVDAVQVMSYDAVSKSMIFLGGKGFTTTLYMMPHDVPENRRDGVVMSKMLVFQINDTDVMDYPAKNRELVKSEGFRSFFITPLIVNFELRGLIQVFLKQPFYPDGEWIQFYETLAGQAAIAINESILWKNLQVSNIELQTAYDETLEGWSKALDLRDHETENHTQRVIELTLRLAKKMGITGDELINIRRGALLHDLGKIGVPDSILTKPGKLTPEEWDVMRRHPTNAYDLIFPISYLREALDIPYSHHEKWDGSGYPRGLKGEDIPLAARIFAFADVWDAMTSDRYYRAAMSVEDVTKYMRENSGKHFDPSIVELFLEMDKK
jgi:PAS domain S-box-containing protein